MKVDSYLIDLCTQHSLPGFHTSVGGGGERQDDAWYAKHGIRFQGKTRVVELDVQTKAVKCEDGTEYSYDKLIIATGAEVLIVLPACCLTVCLMLACLA
jgi:NADPH-dependent 2,4-dienoyl-CoA reductase/sulfur reductase-like enzyme